MFASAPSARRCPASGASPVMPRLARGLSLAWRWLLILAPIVPQIDDGARPALAQAAPPSTRAPQGSSSVALVQSTAESSPTATASMTATLPLERGLPRPRRPPV